MGHDFEATYRSAYYVCEFIVAYTRGRRSGEDETESLIGGVLALRGHLCRRPGLLGLRRLPGGRVQIDKKGQSSCTSASEGHYVDKQGRDQGGGVSDGQVYGDPAVCAPPVIQHVDDGTRNIHGHCGRDYRDQVLCGVT